jgi:hypothetical protein
MYITFAGFQQTPNEALPFGTIPLFEELLPDITGETSQKPSPDTDVRERPATDTVAPDTLASSAVETLALQTQDVQSHSTAETVTLDSPPDQEPTLTETVTLDPLASPAVEALSSQTQDQSHSATETLASDAPRL